MTAGVPGAIPPVTDTAPHWVKKPELESVFLRDDRQPNNDTTSVPWRSVCHLVVGRQNGSRSFGTGWFAGPKMVITAAHCVLDHRPRAGWASSITVIPGRNGNYFPFQSQDVASVYIDPRWEREQDHRYDFAVLIMPDRQLGTAVSWFGFAALTDSYLSKPLLINCAGYPDDKPRGTQWSDGGRIERFDENFLYYYIDTEVGQSGSPIFF